MLSMERLFLSLFTLTIVFGTPLSVFADISGLIPCRDSSTFQRRLDSSVAKLTARLTNYEEGTPAYLALQDQIDRTKLRFDKYGKQGLLCSAEGLSHLIADGTAMITDRQTKIAVGQTMIVDGQLAKIADVTQ